jgi:LysR family hydrogen peroxide-inducible transcriptional activator
MINLPTPQQLRYLLALAEHMHFGRAANACAVTQSTLSAGILALERQLDAAILERDGGKRVVFTALGRDVVARSRTAMAALVAITETTVAARAPMSGPLRLGIIPTLGPFLLPRLMPALRAAFPKLRLYLLEDLTERLNERLVAGLLDVAVLALPCACPGSETLSVARDPFMVALPRGHHLAGRDAVSVSALATERMLLLEEGHCLREHALQACGFARGENPADGLDGFAATSLHTLVQMVAGGMGLTLLPQVAIAAGITAGTDIVLRPLTGLGGWRTLGLAWREGSARAADYRALAPLVATAAA